jgi:hypothetical protein
MSCVAPLSPLKIQLRAVPFWGQPGVLPTALKRPILAPVQVEAIPLNSPRPAAVDPAEVQAAIIPLKPFVPRSAQHSTINDGLILFPVTF